MSLKIILFLTFFLFSLSVLSQDSSFSGSHEDGFKLLEEKRFHEAEKLALSLLASNPSDPKAELILANSMIGLGREESSKRNYFRAVELLQKASLKFPFDQSLKDEITSLRKKATNRNFNQTSFNPHLRGSENVDSGNYSNLIISITELNSTIKRLLEFEKQKEVNSNFSKIERIIIYAFGFLTLFLVFLNLLFLKKSWGR